MAGGSDRGAMNSLIPYRHIIINTFLSSEKAESILSSSLESKRRKRTLFQNLRGGSGAFRGTVSNDGFTIKRDIPLSNYYTSNSFSPILYGRFNEHPRGVQVDVKMTMHPLANIFMVFWFGTLGFRFIGKIANTIATGLVEPELFWIMILVLFGYSLMMLSYNYEANRASDFIHRVFNKYHRR